eukprot:PhF_6_TR29111/c0_g1_i4/m.42477
MIRITAWWLAVAQMIILVVIPIVLIDLIVESGRNAKDNMVPVLRQTAIQSVTNGILTRIRPVTTFAYFLGLEVVSNQYDCGTDDPSAWSKIVGTMTSSANAYKDIPFAYLSYQLPPPPTKPNTLPWGDCGYEWTQKKSLVFERIDTNQTLRYYASAVPFSGVEVIPPMYDRDYSEESYVQAIKSISQDQLYPGEGTWLEAYPYQNFESDSEENFLDSYILITYTIPLAFDPVTKFCTKAISVDLTLDWLGELIASDRISVTQSHRFVVEMKSGALLATTWPKTVDDVLLDHIELAVESRHVLVRESWTQMVNRYITGDLVTVAQLTIDGTDYTVTVQVFSVPKNLRWAVVELTESSFYDSIVTGYRNTAIIISVITAVVLILLSCSLWALLLLPLKRLNFQLFNYERLEADALKPSVFHELADVLTAVSKLRPVEEGNSSDPQPQQTSTSQFDSEPMPRGDTEMT